MFSCAKKKLRQIGPLRAGDILFLAASFGLFFYFLFHPSFYTTGSLKNGTLSIGKKKLLLELLLLFGSLFLTLYRPMLQELLQKRRRALLFLLTAATPFVTFQATDIITRSIPRNFSKNASAALTVPLYWMNILIVSMLLLLLVVLTNRLRASCMICLFSGILFCIANYFVNNFRGTPIQVSDLTSLGAAADVASGYSYTVNATIVITVQGALVFSLLFCLAGDSRLFADLKRRAVFTLLSVLLLGVFVRCFILSGYVKKHGGKYEMFWPLRTYYHSGTYVALLLSYSYTAVEKPDGYSPEAAAEIASAYPSDKAALSKDYPNLIFVLNESFSDLDIIGDFETTEDYMPFMRSLMKDYTHGYCYASTYGGGTANMELELLTLNSLRIIPSGVTAFQVYIHDKMPALADVCKSLGYQGNYVMHPNTAKNYNRLTVYPRLGFDVYLSKNDFPEDAPRLRGHLDDMAVNDMIFEKYEEARAVSDAPFMFYTITMQNHGGYHEVVHDRLSMTTHRDGQVEEFLNLIKHSDEALEELVRYFEKVDEPTVILFLGDHQPNLPDSWLTDVTDGAYLNWSREESMKRYAVPFVIWSNYELPVREYSRCSTFEMQSILFDLCGLPMTGYQKYVLDLLNDVRGLNKRGYWGADGQFYSGSDSGSPYYEKLKEYDILLYNNVFDPDNRPEGFYTLS